MVSDNQFRMQQLRNLNLINMEIIRVEADMVMAPKIRVVPLEKWNHTDEVTQLPSQWVIEIYH